jgi:pyridoxamine 5'-phosphate oxidase
MTIADIRKDYTLNGLDEKDINQDPIKQFKQWFDEAIESQIPEPNGMVMSTITPQGRPNSRVVLLKGLDERGFVFYSNYNSRKGSNIAQNAFVSLNFWWVELERQVRIEGRVTQVSAEESDVYFNSRPYGSKIGAWVSNQSEIIANRDILIQKQTDLEAQYPTQVPRPPHWGGYRVVADRIEFWQGRSSRLHDRLCYQLIDNEWKIERLSP